MRVVGALLVQADAWLPINANASPDSQITKSRSHGPGEAA
ncbi:hypothetical protein APY03_6598 [Variovorax sp. WDL1]|nr:hypothetical protein APY03_6598 [Variovorax sp. WDL1]